jgi:hypothetical protein
MACNGFWNLVSGARRNSIVPLIRFGLESELIVVTKIKHSAVYRTFLVVGLFVWVIVTLSIDNGHVGVFHDDGIYLVSAQAIRDGRGYILPSRPGNPPPKYPIGFPLALALLMRSVPGPASLARDVAVARSLVAASGLVFLVAAYRWLRAIKVPDPVAAFIVLATAFHPATLVGTASAIFSDLSFCALTYLVFLRSSRPQDSAPAGEGRSGLVGGLLAGAGYLVRSNGVTLILATLVDSARKTRPRRRLVANILGTFLVVAASWLITTSSFRAVPSGGYAHEMRAGWSSLRAGLAIVGTNLWAVFIDFPSRVLLPATVYISPIQRIMVDHSLMALTFRLTCSALVTVGIIHLAHRGRGRALAVWVHALATILLFLIWPWTMILDRFLLGLVPLALLAFWAGIIEVGRRAWAIRPSPFVLPSRLAFGALVLATIGIGGVAARSAYVFHANGRQWPGASNRRSLSAALALIDTGLEADAVIAARWPDTVSLYTGRQSVPLTEDDAILLGQFDRGDRLRLWMDRVPDRPFYLLIRNHLEDPSLADRRQADALARMTGVDVQSYLGTRDGRYELLRVIRH